MLPHEFGGLLSLTSLYGRQYLHVIHTTTGKQGLLPCSSALNEALQGNLALDGGQKEAVARGDANHAMKFGTDVERGGVE